MLVLRPLKPFAFTSAPSRTMSSSVRIGSTPIHSLVCVGVPGAVGAAMRPVQQQPVADRAAEHLVDRHAQCLGLDIDQRILDRGDRHRVDAAGGLPRRGIEIGRVALDRPRVLADQALGHLADDAGQPLRAVPLHVFRPADDALVGRDLEKRIDPPAGVAMQVFDLDDFHDGFLQNSAVIARSRDRLIQQSRR